MPILKKLGELFPGLRFEFWFAAPGDGLAGHGYSEGGDFQNTTYDEDDDEDDYLSVASVVLGDDYFEDWADD
jgi:hypothetical protein